MEFQNKAAVITGASSGLGRQIAIDLARRGVKLALIGRDLKNLNETLNLVNNGSKIYLCDVSDKEQAHKAAAKIIGDFGFVDFLINNAGFNINGEFEKLSILELESIMNVNYFGTMYFIKEFLPSMIERKCGHIINISSICGLSGSPKSAAYCASKFAVVGLSESLYFELKRKGISISVVCPGAIKTNFFKHESFDDTIYRAGKKRMMPAERVSKAVLGVIESKRFIAVLPLDAKCRAKLKCLMPKAYMRAIDMVYQKVLYRK